MRGKNGEGSRGSRGLGKEHGLHAAVGKPHGEFLTFDSYFKAKTDFESFKIDLCIYNNSQEIINKQSEAFWGPISKPHPAACSYFQELDHNAPTPHLRENPAPDLKRAQFLLVLGM